MKITQDQAYSRRELYKSFETDQDFRSKVLNQYIEVLKEYDQALGNLRAFNETKTYLVDLMISQGVTTLKVNDDTIEISKYFKGYILKLK